MSRINIHNYEAFLLDHAEGNLDPSLTAELQAFADMHPELGINLSDVEFPKVDKQEFDAGLKNSLSEIVGHSIIDYLENNLTPEEKARFEELIKADSSLASEVAQFRKTILEPVSGIIFPSRQELLKTEEPGSEPEVLRYLENDLTEYEKPAFELKLQKNPSLKDELDLYKKTLLVPDRSIVFENKEALRKNNRVISLFSRRSTFAAAAALLLVFFLSVTLRTFFTGNNVTAGEKAHKNVITKVSPKIVQPATKSGMITESFAFKKNRSDKSNNSKKSASRTDTVIAPKNISVPSPELPVQEMPALVKMPADSSCVRDIASKQRAKDTTGHQVITDIEQLAFTIDSEETEKGQNKQGFWHRIARMAGQANKLGIKSVDGVEDSEERYRVSFNSFSVEKK
jgi:hypothetical protein